jgi:hypothetical protein
MRLEWHKLAILARHVEQTVDAHPYDEGMSAADVDLRYQAIERLVDDLIRRDPEMPNPEECQFEVDFFLDYYTQTEGNHPLFKRDYLPTDSFGELCASMADRGLMEPPTVVLNRASEVHTYIIFIGARRWRAARHMKWPTIKCRIHDMTENDGLGQLISIEEVPVDRIYHINTVNAAGRRLLDLPRTVEELPEEFEGKLVTVRMLGETKETMQGEFHFIDGDVDKFHLAGDEVLTIKMENVLVVTCNDPPYKRRHR